VRSFVIVGRSASSTGQFSLADLPSTSGRLDVLLRCLRAALLISHGLRAEVRVYLVLGGGPTPRVLRVDSAQAKFLRPDERSLAILVQKALLAAQVLTSSSFIELRPGIAHACGDLSVAISDVGTAELYVLEEGAPDIRGALTGAPNMAFFIGDHVGFDGPTRELLARLQEQPVSVGPLSLHSDDVVTLVSNELDRR
jgi:tRNA (pseudouridine54-N1)-methyltransferase